VSSAKMDYWTECVSIAAEECGLPMTQEQLEHVAGAVEGAHECYGMAFYSPPAGEHLSSEISRLKKELADERSKVVCGSCGGSGRLKYNTGPWAVDSHCSRCNGEGRHKP